MAPRPKLKPTSPLKSGSLKTGGRPKAAEPRKAAALRQLTAVEKAAQGKRPGPAQFEIEPDWICSWDFELAARAAGALRVAGVDEVGRGPLFGPVVAAAVILPAGAEFTNHFEGLNDSKKLSEEEREHFDVRVREAAVAWAIAEVDVATIDRINILQASRLAMKIAVEGLRQRGCDPDHLLIDGNQKIDCLCRQTTIVQGDGRSLSIAAASVIAKVHRDRLLCELDSRYPGYGLASNKGYATAAHREALQRLGITELHRRSFAPVAQLFELEVEGLGIELEFDLLDE